MAPGDYTVQIGHSVTEIVAERFVTLAGESVVAELSLHVEDGMKMARGMTLHQFAGFLPAALPADRLGELIKLSRTTS